MTPTSVAPPASPSWHTASRSPNPPSSSRLPEDDGSVAAVPPSVRSPVRWTRRPRSRRRLGCRPRRPATGRPGRRWRCVVFSRDPLVAGRGANLTVRQIRVEAADPSPRSPCTRRSEAVGRRRADHREGRLRRSCRGRDGRRSRRPRQGRGPRRAPQDPAQVPREHPRRPPPRRASSAASAAPTAGTGWPGRPTPITVADIIRAVEGPLADVHGTPPETVEYGGAATPPPGRVGRHPVGAAGRARGGDRGRRGGRHAAAVRGPLPRRARGLGPALTALRALVPGPAGSRLGPRPHRRASVDHLCPAGSTSS